MTWTSDSHSTISRLAHSEKQPVHDMPSAPNTILSIESVSSKSSIINMMAERDVATVGGDMHEVTLASTR
ncbi:hypothetical protein H2248_002686 [Termitomyces sp. 'cryptogamus']|nr:hypothetical protein H2248_002686 [Termitomyces sp. 'cryptogamus']